MEMWKIEINSTVRKILESDTVVGGILDVKNVPGKIKNR